LLMGIPSAACVHCRGLSTLETAVNSYFICPTPLRQWLDRHFPGPLCEPDPPAPQKPILRLPPPQPRHLERVRNYLILQRGLPPELIHSLIQSGSLYADPHANAVFLLLGKENNPVGAELRGSGPLTWRGMAPGSQKDIGFFAAPVPAPSLPPTQPPPAIILCESAIDALSCFVLHPGHHCISTAGARPHPAWLPDLLATGSTLYCGFDADPTGDAMAQAMMARHPAVRRLRPPLHDWNDTLRSLS
ncbi:MAG: DUF3991 and TOPRIM domain-containing protein, partial [Verrucomicrobia bacterium]|nr:DUF3991 and TOPRIM domain-containing protein [Verrucomicrobiota bacterium]